MSATPDTSARTVLAFDFGLRRIGVAVGQSVTRTANPLTVLAAQDGAPQWAEITQLIDTWGPQALIVGLPVHMDGAEQELTRAARRFGNRLNGRYNLPVFWQDERLTSAEADWMLAEAARNGARSSHETDSMAAALILETWLAQQPRHGNLDP